LEKKTQGTELRNFHHAWWYDLDRKRRHHA